MDCKLNEHNVTDSGCQMKEMQALASRGSRLGLGGSRRKQQRSESGSCSPRGSTSMGSPSEGRHSNAAEGKGKMHKFCYNMMAMFRNQ